MDGDKPVPVIVLPSVRYIGGPIMQVITGIIQGLWDPEISVAVITTAGIPLEDSLAGIGMKTRNLVIHMEFDGEAYWVKSLGEVWPTQNVNQWVYWLNNPSSV